MSDLEIINDLFTLVPMDNPELDDSFMPRTAYDPAGCRPAADVARLLHDANIPSCLWGFLAIALAGKDRRHEKIEFVISDDCVDSAANALREAGFPICSDPKCDEVRYDIGRFRPAPDVHSHLESIDGFYNLLSLFKKSTTLWWLPDFTLSPPAEDDPHFMLSNDPRLPPRKKRGGCGPWTELYPIKTLNPGSLTDSYLFLYIRDVGQLNGFTSRWVRMLIPLMEYEKCPVQQNVRPEFQEFWTNATSDFEMRKLPLWAPLHELRKRMVNELPPPPPINSYGSLEAAQRCGVGWGLIGYDGADGEGISTLNLNDS